MVVDPGIPSNAVAALDAMRSLGGDPREAVITATHAHSDHVAGMPVLHRRVGAPLYLPAKVRDYLAGELPRNPGIREILRITPVLFEQPFDVSALVEAVRSARDAGFAATPFRFDQPIAGFLDDDEHVPNAPDWQILRTPGHTDCSTCLWNAKTATLISGDTVLTYDGRAWFNPETTDPVLMDATERWLRSLPVEHLLPGHGVPVSGPNLMKTALSHRDRAPRGWWLKLPRRSS